MTRMFNFVSKTFNPGAGCNFKCSYCWTPHFRKRLSCEACRSGVPHLHTERFNARFREGEIVFLLSMGDIACFCDWEIEVIIEIVRRNPRTQFLILTKDPRVFLHHDFPENVIMGATIETDQDTSFYSYAPPPLIRLGAMLQVSAKKSNPRFISVEPILDFTDNFPKLITNIEPNFGVAVGYDNYNNHLLEPPLEKTKQMIKFIEEKGYNIYLKTIRRAWFE